MPPDVYTAQDIAAAARVPEGLVTSLVARGEIRSVAALLPAGQPVPPSLYGFIPHDEYAAFMAAFGKETEAFLQNAGVIE